MLPLDAEAAFMCYMDQHWAEALALVLLGICLTFEADLQASIAELVYGEPIRIPGELLTPVANPVEPGTSSSSSTSTWPASDQSQQHICAQQFPQVCARLRQGTMCQALEPPCSGLYQILLWREKTLQRLACGRPITVSTNRLKPPYLLNGTDHRNTTFSHAVNVHTQWD
jgi:hypothetical protein